jgi:hypothetical protein
MLLGKQTGKGSMIWSGSFHVLWTFPLLLPDPVCWWIRSGIRASEQNTVAPTPDNKVCGHVGRHFQRHKWEWPLDWITGFVYPASNWKIVRIVISSFKSCINYKMTSKWRLGIFLSLSDLTYTKFQILLIIEPSMMSVSSLSTKFDLFITCVHSQLEALPYH